jgi:hypothetical protein
MRSNLLVFALSIPMAACAMEVAGEEEPGVDDTEYILHNQLTTRVMVLNSLTGTYGAIEALKNHGLNTLTFGPGGPLAHKLNDPDARTFARYLIECALPAGEAYEVEYTDHLGDEHTFRGKYGLCNGEWVNGAPSPLCRQLVTACLLTRNNAKGVEVRISTRGKYLNNVTAMPLSKAVPVKTTTSSGLLLSSFRDCSTPLNGPARNCGFSSKSLVGLCTPFEDVKLNCSVGSGEMAVRICDGPNGCNHISSLNLHEDSVCGTKGQSTTFTCGGDGAFSVMVGPPSSSKSFAGGFASATGGTYPASENQVFPYEEGSFYGDFFEPGDHESGVIRDVNAIGVITTLIPAGGPITVFRGASACSDSNWLADDAYMTERRCAAVVEDDTEGVLCAADYLGVCFGGTDPACATNDGLPLGDGDNDDCEDGLGITRTLPLTTRLHKPCDLMPPGMPHLCERRDVDIIQ